MDQVQFKFDKVTIEKTLIHAGIIAASAGLVYLMQFLSHQNFGVYQVPATVLLSWFGTLLKEWMSGVPQA